MSSPHLPPSHPPPNFHTLFSSIFNPARPPPSSSYSVSSLSFFPFSFTDVLLHILLLPLLFHLIFFFSFVCSCRRRLHDIQTSGLVIAPYIGSQTLEVVRANRCEHYVFKLATSTKLFRLTDRELLDHVLDIVRVTRMFRLPDRDLLDRMFDIVRVLRRFRLSDRGLLDRIFDIIESQGNQLQGMSVCCTF